MSRIKWGNVFIALLVLLLGGVGLASALAIVHLDDLPGSGTLSELGLDIGRTDPTPTLTPRPRPTPIPTPTGIPVAKPPVAPTSAPAVAPTAPSAPAAVPTAAPVPTATAIPAPDAGFRSEVPVPESQGGNYPLGTITVAFDKEFPPYAPVVLLYQEKLAEKRGLGIHFVPFDIEDHNRISEERRAELLRTGGFDVLLTTMDSYSLWGGPDIGRVTGVIGESAGADKAIVQASQISTFNDLAGKAFAYSDGSVSEYLLYYMLRVAGVPATSVIRLGHENLNQAVRRYLDREANGVVGWTSSDLDTAMKRPGSKVLMTSDQFRVTTDVIVTGTGALQNKRQAVQAFHDAWFDALKITIEQPERAATDMREWNASWTGVNSTQDLTDALSEFAQATLADNQVVMGDQVLPLMQARYKDAQAIWLSGGRKVRRLLRDDELQSVFEPTFALAADPRAATATPPVNPTFHLTAKAQVTGLTPEQQQRLVTVAQLGIKRLQFEPGATRINETARRDIESFVVPVLRNTVGTYLKVEGSAAWPKDAQLTDSVVNAIAFERARAVQDYIVKFGIPVERIVLGTTLPQCRDCKDSAQVQRDDGVGLSLVTPE